MKNKDNSYTAKDIETFEGIKGIRAHPGMYLGDTDSYDGYQHLVNEVIDNSEDEVLAGFSDTILVKLLSERHISIRDFGRGIPVDKYKDKTALEAILEDPHTGGKARAENSAYKISGGLHGIGLKAVVAVSEFFEANIYRDGKKYTIQYKEGVKQGPIISTKSDEETGTEINFIPSQQIFNPELKFIEERIKNRIRDCCYLNPILKIKFTSISGETENFQEKEGLGAMIKRDIGEKETLGEPISLSGTEGNTEINMAFSWFTEVFSGFIKGYTNNIPQIQGTHINGLSFGVCKVIANIAQEDFKTDLKSANVKSALVAIVSVKIKDPRFASQNKERLINEYVKTDVSNFISKELPNIYSKNKDMFRGIIKGIIQQQKAISKIQQIKTESAKKESLFNLDNIYLTDAYDKNPENKEVFIVEGVSASGTVKGARDPKYQAIFAIRGKPLNIVRQSNHEKLAKNDCTRSIINTIGIREDPKYGKIFILADRDYDGRHITAILIGLFAKAMGWVIEENRLNICLSPLYSIKKGQTVKFAYTQKELAQYTLGDSKYKSFLTEDYTELQKELIVEVIKHRFIKKNNKIIEDDKYYSIKGIATINKKNITKDFYLEGYKLLNENPRINPFTEADKEYLVALKSYQITRFKGLGEMQVEQLIPVLSQKDRKIVNIVAEDIEHAQNYVDRLMGDDVKLRKQMISELNLVEEN